MMSNQPLVQVEFTPLFLSFLKHLVKKFRNVRQDLEPLVESLAQGETPGDQVKGTQHTVYKVRLRNTDARRGKCGGY
jgi:mRNA-degrading endonuclease RelE of RelBE toxin-antitoxin system